MSDNHKEQSEETNTYKFSLMGKIMHWGFAILFAYGILKQVNDIDQLEDSILLRFEVNFAVFFLLLLALRFIYMTFRQSTALPADTNHWQKLAAKAVHLGMYISLAAIAITGLMIARLFSMGFKDGLLITLAMGLHSISVTVTYFLISIHVLAAVYHRLRKDGVWNSMVPFWKEK